MAKTETTEEIRQNLKDWCYAKRRENEIENPQWPLFNCMDQAIISVLADMEARIRAIETKLEQAKITTTTTAGLFINEVLLLGNGFEKIERDGFDYLVKDNIEVFDYNGECWVIDMLDQAGIEKQFKYMEELEMFFQSCGLSIYNPKRNTHEH